MLAPDTRTDLTAMGTTPFICTLYLAYSVHTPLNHKQYLGDRRLPYYGVLGHQGGAMTQPPYRRIADDIRDRIERGELRPGQAVPSARQITKEHGVALAT